MNRPDSSRPGLRAPRPARPDSARHDLPRQDSLRPDSVLQDSRRQDTPSRDLPPPGADTARQPDAVLCDIRAGNVRQAYQAIAGTAAARTGLEADYLLDRLMDMEAGASSGVGGGVAIPHLRLKRLEQPFMLFARLNGMVDFQAVDGEPVDMIALLLSPAGDVADHLRRLAHMSRLMRDEPLKAKLRSVENPDGIRALLIDRQTQNLAA